MRFTTSKLSSIADVKTGLPLRRAAKKDDYGNALLVQMKDVDPFEGVNWSSVNKISTEGCRNPDWLRENDVLFVGRGSRFFAVHVKKVRKNSVASPHFYVLRNKTAKKVLPKFLVWYLNGQAAQKFYTFHQDPSGIPYINRKNLSMLPIRLPDIETQKKIVSAHECWRKQRQLLQELTEKKDAYINAILEKTLPGEVV